MVSSTAFASAETAAKPLVLVVDDEYGPREAIAFTLRQEFDVDTAERAHEALAKLKARKFDVVILDIRMPEMDGIKALEEIRKIDGQVSIVMLTGYGTLATAQQAMLGGANQYLRKPPDINELIEAVRRQVGNTHVRRQEAKAARAALDLNAALKREINEKQPHIWQARAAVELVHDLSNPLTVMIGYAGLLAQEAKLLARQDPVRAERLRNYASIVERASEFCHHLAENWRQTTKKTTEFADVDLVEMITGVKQVIFFDNPAIEIVGAEGSIVRGSKFELARVFQNLFKNAFEAGSKSVKVTVLKEEAHYRVTVVDDGSGMDVETARNALRGGFSTKTHGTGMGLSICRHLLGVHGATMALESEPGCGVMLRMLFPQAPTST